MTRLERETLARIRERLAIFDPGAAENQALRTELRGARAGSEKDHRGAAAGAGGAAGGGGRSDAMSAEQTGAFFALVSVCSGLGSVLSLLLLLAKPVRERLFGLSAIREGQRCMLRADMLAAYYKHREEKTIRQYEYENFLYEYKAYKALHGNSFIERIAREVAEWEIVT